VFIYPFVDLHSAFYLKAEEVGDVKASKAVEVILLINELFVSYFSQSENSASLGKSVENKSTLYICMLN